MLGRFFFVLVFRVGKYFRFYFRIAFKRKLEVIAGFLLREKILYVFIYLMIILWLFFVYKEDLKKKNYT